MFKPLSRTYAARLPSNPAFYIFVLVMAAFLLIAGHTLWSMSQRAAHPMPAAPALICPDNPLADSALSASQTWQCLEQQGAVQP